MMGMLFGFVLAADERKRREIEKGIFDAACFMDGSIDSEVQLTRGHRWDCLSGFWIDRKQE